MEQLPKDIDAILKEMAHWAAAYDSGLKWNEEAKLKSDIMKHKDRWILVSPQQVKDRCIELGMSTQDSNKISSFIQKLHQGKKLIPSRSYNDFEYNHKAMLES